MVSKQKEGGNGKVRHCTRGTPTTPQQPHPSCAFSISAFSFSFLYSILFVLQQCYGKLPRPPGCWCSRPKYAGLLHVCRRPIVLGSHRTEYGNPHLFSTILQISHLCLAVQKAEEVPSCASCGLTRVVQITHLSVVDRLSYTAIPFFSRDPLKLSCFSRIKFIR